MKTHFLCEFQNFPLVNTLDNTEEHWPIRKLSFVLAQIRYNNHSIPIVLSQNLNMGKFTYHYGLNNFKATT